MATLSELLTSAAAVRNETAADQNTALRVGNVLYSLTRYLQQYTSVVDITMKVSGVGVTITAKSLSGDTTLFDKTIALPVASNNQAGILTAEAYAAIKADIKELQEAFTDLSASLQDTTELADTATRLLTFSTILENVAIEQQGVSSYDSIAFVSGRGYFVAVKALKYYNSFPGFDKYNDISGGAMKAREDRLYRMLGTDAFYYFNGTALRQLATSAS